jgi:tetratricopeptide (TPR) repeat protein
MPHRKQRPQRRFFSCVDSGSLNAPDTGKAWNILALAYEERGDFTDAQRAYECAIRTLEKLPNHIKDYAMALDDLGGLYLAMGHADPAVRIKEKTLHLYKKIGDHEGWLAQLQGDLSGSLTATSYRSVCGSGGTGKNMHPPDGVTFLWAT